MHAHYAIQAHIREKYLHDTAKHLDLQLLQGVSVPIPMPPKMLQELFTLIAQNDSLNQQKRALSAEQEDLMGKINKLKTELTKGMGSDPWVVVLPNGKHYAVYNDKYAGPSITPVEVYPL